MNNLFEKLNEYKKDREIYLKKLEEKRSNFIDELLGDLKEYNDLTESYFGLPDKSDITDILINEFEVSVVVDKFYKTYYRIPMKFFSDKRNFILKHRKNTLENNIKSYEHNLDCAEEEVTCLTKEISDLKKELEEINKELEK